MSFLRATSKLTRLVLAWFVLSLGVAGASPVMQPQWLELVCSDGAALKLVSIGDDGQTSSTVHGAMDCPLCLGPALPGSPVLLSFDAAATPPAAVERRRAAHIAALVGAPLPPRGPPVGA